MTNDLRQWPLPSVPDQTPDKNLRTGIDNAIDDAVGKQPFRSIQKLSKLTCFPIPIIHQRSHDHLSLQSKLLAAFLPPFR
jgi:hypothetical protein